MCSWTWRRRKVCVLRQQGTSRELTMGPSRGFECEQSGRRRCHSHRERQDENPTLNIPRGELDVGPEEAPQLALAGRAQGRED